ncbi:hypothetical protein CEXT_71081 [Caerostris extrusa]|uniref:Uncharacterized protein n=1 Tax=Caerostris extrusa TaxID=172846 RepID=A0AAV4MTF9_CAEEX|nr:hypothetical protein CEXT_71081 [Caerostris extrusa]
MENILCPQQRVIHDGSSFFVFQKPLSSHASVHPLPVLRQQSPHYLYVLAEPGHGLPDLRHLRHLLRSPGDHPDPVLAHLPGGPREDQAPPRPPVRPAAPRLGGRHLLQRIPQDSE